MHSKKIYLVIGVAIGLSLLEQIFAQFVYTVFAYPSAFLSSVFMGQVILWNEEGKIIIPMASQSVRITQSCTGYGFFCFLLALLISYFDRLGSKKGFFAYLGLIIPLTYAVTIVVNGCRIVSGYYVNEVVKFLLPPNFLAAVHLGVGITFFLSALLLISFIIEKNTHKVGCK